MSDFSGLAGALMLSGQMSTDRLLDRRARARNNNQLAVDNAVLRQRCAELVQHNQQLVRDKNNILQNAVKVAELYDRQIAVTKQTTILNIGLTEECEALRLRLLDVTTQLALFRKIAEQDHPDAFFSQ